MESARAAMGGINLLVNCAGVIGAGRVLGKNGPMAGDFFTARRAHQPHRHFSVRQGGRGHHAEQRAHAPMVSAA